MRALLPFSVGSVASGAYHSQYRSEQMTFEMATERQDGAFDVIEETCKALKSTELFWVLVLV